MFFEIAPMGCFSNSPAVQENTASPSVRRFTGPRWDAERADPGLAETDGGAAAVAPERYPLRFVARAATDRRFATFARLRAAVLWPYHLKQSEISFSFQRSI